MRVARAILPATLLALSTLLAIPAQALELIPMRSGNGVVNGPDAIIRYAAYGCCTDHLIFNGADFLAAASGPFATVVGPAHPLWAQTLSCDPDAQWIGTAPGAPPNSALYAYQFTVQTHCIQFASLDFCWLVDDLLGSPQNPAGVYLNGVSIASIAGGNLAAATTVAGTNITAILSPGVNTLFIWDQDSGAIVSGVNFSALIRVEECPTPTEPTTWSNVKARFQ